MITSPCINICQMDARYGLCIGCFRTIDEITLWSHSDDATRANILAAITTRRLKHDPGNGKPLADGDQNV